MRIHPLNDRVLVKRLEAEHRTSSGILIPDAATEKPDRGKVVAAGAGKILDDGKVHALDVKVGDKVLFGRYSGHAIKVGGEELLVMREDDIIAVMED